VDDYCGCACGCDLLRWMRCAEHCRRVCVAVHPARVQAVVQDNRSKREREEEARAKKRAFKDERDLRKKESREEDEEHAREMAKVGAAGGGGGGCGWRFPVSSSQFPVSSFQMQFAVCSLRLVWTTVSDVLCVLCRRPRAPLHSPLRSPLRSPLSGE
jgi:hypothetical protein